MDSEILDEQLQFKSDVRMSFVFVLVLVVEFRPSTHGCATLSIYIEVFSLSIYLAQKYYEIHLLAYVVQHCIFYTPRCMQFYRSVYRTNHTSPDFIIFIT